MQKRPPGAFCADTSTFCGFGALTVFGTGSSGAFVRNGDSFAQATLRILDVTSDHQQIACARGGDVEQTRFLGVEERALLQHVVVPTRRLGQRLAVRPFTVSSRLLNDKPAACRRAVAHDAAVDAAV